MNIPPPHISRSKRRSISLIVTPDGELLLKAPNFVSDSQINEFLSEKEEWIQKTLQKLSARKIQKKTYQEGEAFLFMGKELRLQFYHNLEIALDDEHILLPRGMSIRVQKELMSWYKKQAETIITQRVLQKAKEMDATYTNIFFSDTKSKWGTCFPDNTLQFNWRLIMAPLLVIDYVVIHELSHTTEKNHGDKFWKRVRSFTPAYKQHRKWLEENGHLLIV